MKTVLLFLSIAFMPFLAAPAGAQQAAISTGTVTAVQPPAKQDQKRKAVPARAQTEKKEPASGDQYEQEGAVIIDAGSDEDSSARVSDNQPAAAAEPEDTAGRPRRIPASYGQLKGTLNDGGRSLLVFENESGGISFVQIGVGKNSVTWRLVSKISRSAD